jgi:hypothetical protein
LGAQEQHQPQAAQAPGQGANDRRGAGCGVKKWGWITGPAPALKESGLCLGKILSKFAPVKQVPIMP